MPRFALSGIFLIGASLVLFAGATEGPRAVPVARDTWTAGTAWLSSALSSAIDQVQQARRRVPEKAGPPLGLASPPAIQRMTGPPAATPLSSATVASPSGVSSPAAPTPRSIVTSPREVAAPATTAASRDFGDTPRVEINDLRNQVIRSQTEIASLSAERDRAREELEALRQQRQTQAGAPPESRSLEKIAASNVSPRSPVTASRGIRARQRRHSTTVYRQVRTPGDAPPRFSSEFQGLY